MEACGDLLLARGRPCLNLKEAAETFSAPLDYAKIFTGDGPVEMEVGSGNGGFLLELARREQGTNFLAVEVCTNVLLTAMERTKKAAIENIRFLNIPAEILPCYIPPRSVRRIYLNFSTPLPSSSSEKQRLTSDRFLAIYRELLAEGGEIVQKTDSLPFFEYSLERYAANGFCVSEITRDLHHSEYAEGNIVTEYEANFLKQGLPICRCVARKLS